MFALSYSSFGTDICTSDNGIYIVNSMLFLSYGVCGYSIFSNTPPIKQSYNKLSLYGNCVVDALVMHNVEKDDATVIDHFNDVNPPTFNMDTIYVANYEESLEAGSLITNVGLPLNQYAIRRKQTGSSLNPLLATLDWSDDLHTYTDYTPKNKYLYTYEVTPVFYDGVTRLEGRGVEGSGSVSFFGWTLSDTAATPTQYFFNVEIETDNFSVKRGFKLFENHTRYPSVRFNNMEYRTSKLTVVPLDNNLEIDDSRLQELLTFLNDGNEKILRSPSGDALRVIISDVSYKYYDKIQEQPLKLEFQFVEVGTV